MIHVLELIKHKESGRLYTVVSFGKMRTGKDRWIASVTYRDCKTGETYTRGVDSYKKEFETIENIHV